MASSSVQRCVLHGDYRRRDASESARVNYDSKFGANMSRRGVFVTPAHTDTDDTKPRIDQASCTFNSYKMAVYKDFVQGTRASD